MLAPLAGKLRIAHAAARAGEQTTKAESAATATTAEKDQTDLSVTVYNSNLALVRDIAGRFTCSQACHRCGLKTSPRRSCRLQCTFGSLTDPVKVNVVEQNYEYDLLDPQKLLQKYVGREVTLVQRETDSGSTKWVETKALLLSDNGSPGWKIGDEIVAGTAAESYRFPDLPANLYSQPTLVWTLDNRGEDAQRVEASYLTNNVNRSGDYVLNVARDGRTGPISTAG